MAEPAGWDPGQPWAPLSTYRLQLRPGFGFAEAGELADYLADLGVTHVYLSPILQANPGSPHGYDVVDHSRVSADLGGEDAFRAMADRFHRHHREAQHKHLHEHSRPPLDRTTGSTI